MKQATTSISPQQLDFPPSCPQPMTCLFTLPGCKRANQCLFMPLLAVSAPSPVKSLAVWEQAWSSVRLATPGKLPMHNLSATIRSSYMMSFFKAYRKQLTGAALISCLKGLVSQCVARAFPLLLPLDGLSSSAVQAATSTSHLIYHSRPAIF